MRTPKKNDATGTWYSHVTVVATVADDNGRLTRFFLVLSGIGTVQKLQSLKQGVGISYRFDNILYIILNNLS